MKKQWFFLSTIWSIIVIGLTLQNVANIEASSTYTQQIIAPLPATSSATDVENPRWKILVLIYSTTDFTYTDGSGSQHRVVASMTQEEKDRAANAATRFFEVDVPALTSGNMRPILTIRYPDRALTELEPFCGYWPSRASTAPELDPALDSVVVIWDSSGTDVNTGQPSNLQNCGGLTVPNGTGQTYATFQVDSVSSNQRNVFKHEWGHSILYYFDAAGTAPKPTVNNHINDTDTQYVHCPTGEPYILVDETDDNPIPNSIYNNDVGFTHDYYSGTTATPDQPTRCLGITPDAWASGGPVTKPPYRVYLPYILRNTGSVGVKLYVTNGANGVSVVDTSSNTIVATIPTGSQAQGITSKPDGSRAYSADSSSNRVSVMNLANNSVVTTIPTGNGPVIPAISSDGRRLYVTNYASSSVSVIDTSTNTVIRTIANVPYPWGVAVSPNRSRIAVTLYWNRAVSIFDTSTFSEVTDITVGINPEGVIYHPDGSKLYVANLASSSISVINVGTNTVIQTIPVGNRPGNNPVQLTFNADATRLYVANDVSNTVSEIDVATGIVLRNFNVGSSPRDVEVVNQYLYVTNSGSDSVSVVDLNSGTTIKTITGFYVPHSITAVGGL